MRLRLLAAGTRLPSWVNEGYEEYAARLKGEFKLELIEIPVAQRAGSDVQRAVAKEGERMLSALQDRPYVVALQVRGKALTTGQLAKFLEQRAQDGRDIAFCIGGPDGLAPEIDGRADFRWSLSSLTLPHGLARVVIAEALYRAVSVIKRLPYHRA